MTSKMERYDQDPLLIDLFGSGLEFGNFQYESADPVM
jgi:hypothetical protein